MNVFLPDVHVPFSAAHVRYFWDFALLVFRINSRMPPPDGGHDFLDLTCVWDINKR